MTNSCGATPPPKPTRFATNLLVCCYLDRRRANENIGERPCINGDRCLANFIGRVRFGADTDKCFTCTEFLLPDQLERFKAGKGLPATRGKCLLCARCAALPNVEFCLHCPHANCSSLHRYYQNYLYILVNACPYPQCPDTTHRATWIRRG